MIWIGCSKNKKPNISDQLYLIDFAAAATANVTDQFIGDPVDVDKLSLSRKRWRLLLMMVGVGLRGSEKRHGRRGSHGMHRSFHAGMMMLLGRQGMLLVLLLLLLQKDSCRQSFLLRWSAKHGSFGTL